MSITAILAGLGMGAGAAGGFLDTYLNYQTAQQNFRRQDQNQAYQQGLQQTIFNREDNSYQRQVADLRAAGLNPILATGAGGAGAGQAISTQAPQNDYKSQIGDKINQALALMQMKKNIENTGAQRDLIEAQIQKVGTETAIDRWNLAKADQHGVATTQLQSSELGRTVREMQDFFQGDMAGGIQELYEKYKIKNAEEAKAREIQRQKDFKKNVEEQQKKAQQRPTTKYY